MTKIQQTALFDYASLDGDTAKLAKESAIEIKAREKAVWENIIEIGNKLIQVKEVLPHGQFDNWITFEFDWGKTTAVRYMKITEELSKKPHGVFLQNISMKALYQLASGLSKADEETKEEILEDVKTTTEEKGKPLTEKEIKEITNKYEKQLKEQQERIERYQQTQLDFMNAQDCLKKEKEKLEKEYEKVTEILSEKNSTITELNGKIKSLNILIVDKENLAQKLESKIEAAKKDLEKFKNNPDPEVKKKVTALKKELEELKYTKTKVVDELGTIQEELRTGKQEYDTYVEASTALARLIGGIEDVFAKNKDALKYLATQNKSPEFTKKAQHIADLLRNYANILDSNQMNTVDI